MKKTSSKIIDSIISKGSEFKGEFTILGNVKVDGVFRGRIISDGRVIIGTSGIGICDIIAKEVVVGGEIRGNIIGLEKITFLATGNLKGNIMTPSLSMDVGVKFNGYCKINYDLFKEKVYKLEDMTNIKIISNSNKKLMIESISENDNQFEKISSS